jgi:hypothetical protein
LDRAARFFRQAAGDGKVPAGEPCREQRAEYRRGVAGPGRQSSGAPAKPSPGRLKPRLSAAHGDDWAGWTRPVCSNYVRAWQDQSRPIASAVFGTSAAKRRAGFPCSFAAGVGISLGCPTDCCCGGSASCSRLNKPLSGASVAAAGRWSRRRGRPSFAIQAAGDSDGEASECRGHGVNFRSKDRLGHPFREASASPLRPAHPPRRVCPLLSSYPVASLRAVCGVQGGDKPGHWSAGILLSAAE